MKPNVYNFFKFLKDKEDRPIPVKTKLIHAPETLTPQELNVEGDLDLENIPITSLPKGLTVGGYLDLKDCTSLEKLPEGLKVERYLNLENTPLAKQTNKEIKAMIGPTGYINGKIYR